MSSTPKDLFSGLQELPPPPLAIPRKGGADPMLGESGYDRADDNFYSTEEWVTRLLMAKYHLRGPIWEPACGDGRMSRVLAKRFEVISSDIVDRGFGDWVQLDFLKATEPPNGREIGGIVTNPPYGDGLDVEFVCHALTLTRESRGFVAMFLRTEWCHASGRRYLYEVMPLALKIHCLKRPRWKEEENADKKKGPRHNYAWYIWDWQAPELGLRRMAWGP